MAWNKPGEDKKEERGGQMASRPRRWGLVAAAVVAALCAAVVVIWCFSGKGDRGGDEKPVKVRHGGAIAVATNTAVRVAQTETTNTAESVEVPAVPYWEVDASQTNGFSETMVKKWEHRHRPKYEFNLPKRQPRAKYRIFRHRSENEIAALLMAKPGASMIGSPRYHGLTEDFMKSCEEPIIVTADDDEYTAKLKRDMIQAKIELRQRMADGEILEKIIEETRAEYRKMSEYRRALTKEVMDMIRKDDVSEEDVDLFVEAANKMLDAKGIAPIKISGITKQWIINNKGEL